MKKKAKMQNLRKIRQIVHKYPNLNNLLMDRNHQKLRYFVIGMLQLKHPLIIDNFLHAYNIIIGEIINTKLGQVYYSAERTRIIDEIIQKITVCGECIEVFLMEQCGFAAGL